MVDKSTSQHLFADVLARVHAACSALATEGNWPAGIDLSRVTVEPPRDSSHGDMATNAAMVLAKEARKNPRELANEIAAHLKGDQTIRQIDVAGPGFINLTLCDGVWVHQLRRAVQMGPDFGRGASDGHRVNVEYVSA